MKIIVSSLLAICILGCGKANLPADTKGAVTCVQNQPATNTGDLKTANITPSIDNTSNDFDNKTILERIKEKISACPSASLENIEQWINQSKVIAETEYRSSTYPCIFEKDVIAMPSRSIFKVKEVLKGCIAGESFDGYEQKGDWDKFPHDYITGRTYIVFLDPRPESIKRLENASTIYRVYEKIENYEFVAVLDLSQTKEEYEALKTIASKSGKFGNYEFAPEKWTAFRNAETVDLQKQEEILPFILNIVLASGNKLKDVRSYLGVPDYYYINEDGYFHQYMFNLEAHNNPKDGVICSWLEIGFDPKMKLIRYSFEHHKKTPEGNAWLPLSQEEIKALKITSIEHHEP